MKTDGRMQSLDRVMSRGKPRHKSTSQTSGFRVALGRVPLGGRTAREALQDWILPGTEDGRPWVRHSWRPVLVAASAGVAITGRTRIADDDLDAPRGSRSAMSADTV
jgi:hypothetical protein